METRKLISSCPFCGNTNMAKLVFVELDSSIKLHKLMQCEECKSFFRNEKPWKRGNR